MKGLYKIIGSILLLLSLSANADWTGAKKITMIYPQAQNASVLFKQISVSSSQCPGSAGEYYVLEPTHPNYSNLYSLLLAAYSMQEPVNILLSGCSTEGYSKISMVIMQK